MTELATVRMIKELQKDLIVAEAMVKYRAELGVLSESGTKYQVRDIESIPALKTVIALKKHCLSYDLAKTI